jgi:hypothetical protein
LAHTAHATLYGTSLLYEEQITEDMVGFEHSTETFSNYNFDYYYIPAQPYARFSPGQTRKHYFLQLQVTNPQHSPNHCSSFSKFPYYSSDMLSVYHSYATKAIITA